MSQEEIGPQRIKGYRIPLSCPNCTGMLSLEGYDVSIKSLKPLYWHNCSHCGFEKSVDDFKKELFTV